MRFPIQQVPQANDLANVISTIEAISNGYESDIQIGDYVGFSDRQGRYYRLAGELLGLLITEKKKNKSILTPLGIELIELDKEHRKIKIKTIIEQNPFFTLILEFIKSKTGTSRVSIVNYIKTIVDGSESTIVRRASTVVNWLLSAELIYIDDDNEEEENLFYYNEVVDEEGISEDEKELNYSSYIIEEELDIKEIHIQVIALLRKNAQNKIIIPAFQRNKVWTKQQMSKFIESLVLNIPIPPIYVTQDQNGSFIVIDGLQRISAIVDFFQNRYTLVGRSVLKEYNGFSCEQLPSHITTRIEDRALLLYALKSTIPLPIIYDIFHRINSNGTQLTRQEVRNGIYLGKSTDLLKELAESKEFKTVIGDGIASIRMKDREAVLRYLAFALFDYNSDYQGNLDEFLGKTMRYINRASDQEIIKIKNDFIRTMKYANDFFGKNAFRLPTHISRGRVNIAIFETICVFFNKNNDNFLVNSKKNIMRNYMYLIKDKEYVSSVSSSTGSIKNVKTRFEKTFKILKS